MDERGEEDHTKEVIQNLEQAGREGGVALCVALSGDIRDACAAAENVEKCEDRFLFLQGMIYGKGDCSASDGRRTICLAQKLGDEQACEEITQGYGDLAPEELKSVCRSIVGGKECEEGRGKEWC